MKSLTRFALVLWTAASLIVSPAFAQAQSSASQQDQQTEGQQQTQPPLATQLPDVSQMSVASQPGNVGPISQKHFGLGPDYSRAKSWFPNPFDQYWQTTVPQPTLTNTPKIDQLIQDGKLNLSLDDAISLALENNLDIRVQQYQTWIAQTQLLKAESGGIPQAASTQSVVLGSAPSVSFDPEITVQTGYQGNLSPVNEFFGVGAGKVISEIAAHNFTYNFGYVQGFHSGTSLQVTFDNTRATTDNFGYLFLPYVQSTLTASLSQPLLAGCCFLPTTRYIIEARNGTHQAQAQFLASVIADVSQASIDYWELVYDRQFVNVEKQAVAVSQKLYDDNKKQLQIGTMAPLDVLTAQSQLASDQQALVAARTNELLQQTKLLNDITKDPNASNLANIEIIPTTPIETPEQVTTPIDQLMAEAWQNVPQMTYDRLQMENNKIEVKVTANELKPSLSLFAEYQAAGLTGVAVPIPASELPPGTVPPSGGGVGTALNQMINGTYPTYVAGISLGLPIRNRSAQADSARAQIDDRQYKVLYQEHRNTVYVNVRSELIALEQDRAAVAAAAEATKLANQTLVDEEKKYQLGASDPYQVVLMARDLTGAQGIELRDRINLIEAEVGFDQAMGRTLKSNNITIADALRGKVMGVPNIPGTPDTDASNPPAPHNPWAKK
ncbi:MAG TPA: TolC family protein [Candidatus Acidoferrum sp.]|nr:TolC family protein [Candidatus Acidoferrum sp.]